MKVTDKAYAILHIPTGNLVSRLVNPNRLFWTSYKRAQTAINNCHHVWFKGEVIRPEDLKIVAFSLDANEKI